jgi:hypothetical protein
MNKNTIQLHVKLDGTLCFIAKPETKCLLLLGEHITTRRVSHIEPERKTLRVLFRILRSLFGDDGIVAKLTRIMPCKWRVDMTPAGGGILPKLFTKRAEAITAEIEWLERNVLR